MIAALAPLAWCQALEQAKRAFDAGNYAAAAQLFEKAHRQTPRCEILLYIGLARYRLRQVDPALISFRRAAECDPKLTSANVALGEAYLEKGNEAEALSAFTRALGVDGRDGAALRGAAHIYLLNQVNEKAVPLLAVLAELEPNDPAVRVDLGAAYAATGNREGAEAQFQEALRLKPNHASALVGLSNMHLKNGEEGRAIALLRKAAEVAPKAYEPRFLLGSAYNRLGRYQEALVELQAAARLGGADSSEVHYHLARAYGGLGRADERRSALARFAEITRRSKQDLERQRAALRLVERAKSAVETGDLGTAIAALEEAREARPADAHLLFRLAGLHFDLQRLDAARAYAQEAISLSPSAWPYRFLLGLVEKNSGRWKEARVELETAARLNPSAAEVHNALGQLALEENDRRAAIACFQRAVELDPKEAAYRLNLDAARR